MSLDVRTFSSSNGYGTRGPGQMGNVAVGSRISVASFPNLPGAGHPYSQAQSSTVPLSTADGKETMRSLNDRLAGYLAKVRSLEESNSKLEAQIKQALTERGAATYGDWSAYEKTLAGMKEQLEDLTMDNARLMLQIDNARLAADDFKVKFETENAVHQAVTADIANLRKVISNTNMSRMQLEGEVESLKEELDFLHKSHEEEKQNLMGQIKASSIDVQMDAPKGNDLSEVITNIRRQYESAVQKNQEDSEAWFKTKVENFSAEVMSSTETLQEDRGQLNDLRRHHQVLEIDLEALHSMNRSLEETLRATVERYAREVTLHNGTIQQLEAELGEVRAQVTRQRAEYQALLSIKIKLQEEISTYQRLLEGTGVADGGGKVQGTSAREDVKDKGAGARDDDKIKGAGAREDIKDKGAGARDDDKIKGAGAREDIKDKGAGARDDDKIKGAGARDDVKDKGAGARDDVKHKVDGTHDNIENKGMGAYEDIENTSLPKYDDDSVEFSLEQALYAVPPGLTPESDIAISEETADVDAVPRCELELLSAPTPVVTVRPGGDEQKEEPAGNEEEPLKPSTDLDGEVQERQEEV
ncbi:keratin, type I cytoskeletal 18-like isoform X2 [Electrophorus electricus]|uniref:keratin, type I cytoskeletal 18-like isoform X2 n=1 Tax=Electrophorus electricus TaxID=8005 RepID=UPI0015CFE6FF|nr:keratin, type I cytoskeletal 18-like isoform X2 [Electrophorus electricus]